ncbi:septum formation protein [Nonlabens xylanidelens]|uniref:dTTP/UTP pyrophosphatase n=1 Tax=Nonlabens xylanidelens TaxID=191564 RepID=A0A2S6IIK9_9FLAO|nr:Maf-like protein [Nonlabens xylanidelens]PPK94052.1 septum formation protein [Nonlabens xylanidelens]PQJ22205.1 septum formation protein Maf [Nonlabens xylanidelens]
MLANKFKDTEIILASQSPRRQELLKGLDLDFKIKTRPVDEVYSDRLKGHEITDYLSILKASAFKNDLKENELLITSDTIVWFNDAPLEKPKSATHAREMLNSMSGDFHEVYTSVCFTTSQRQHVINDVTKVHFAPLSEEEIDYYVTNYKPFDKAGAYGVQDWLGYAAVTRLEGCYYNVMGLPLPKVYKFLKEF